MTNYCHCQMKEEEGRCNVIVEAFQVVEKSLKETEKIIRGKKRKKICSNCLEKCWKTG